MPIEVITYLFPANSGNHPVAFTQHIAGAYQSVVDVTERNSIPAERRAAGMLVHMRTSGVSYRLGTGLTNSDWVLESIYGYQHTQTVATGTWLVNHNLGYNPHIDIVDTSGKNIVGLITHPTGGVLSKVEFNYAVTGSGYCT